MFIKEKIQTQSTKMVSKYSDKELNLTTKSNEILNAYCEARRTNSKKELKLSNNDLQTRLVNGLVNGLLSADITITSLTDYNLDKLRLQGTDNRNFKPEDINDLLAFGRVYREINGKKQGHFVKGIYYFNTVKKQWYKFISLENFKLIDNSFKNYSNDQFVINGFKFSGSSVVKVKISDLNKF